MQNKGFPTDLLEFAAERWPSFEITNHVALAPFEEQIMAKAWDARLLRDRIRRETARNIQELTYLSESLEPGRKYVHEPHVYNVEPLYTALVTAERVLGEWVEAHARAARVL